MENRAEEKIVNAFLELCLEKNSIKIPVKEICQKAGVSRVSFYTHFEDAAQLLSSLKERMVADRDEIFKAWPYIDTNLIRKNKPFPMFTEMFSYMARNKKIFRVLWKMDIEFFLYDVDVCKKLILNKFQGFAGSANRIGREPLAAFFAGGIFHILILWIDEKIKASPEEISLTATKLVSAVFKSDI
jgi:AcrR family transcriptional regulator